jgi:hypothetical protein
MNWIKCIGCWPGAADEPDEPKFASLGRRPETDGQQAGTPASLRALRGESDFAIKRDDAPRVVHPIHRVGRTTACLPHPSTAKCVARIALHQLSKEGLNDGSRSAAPGIPATV